MPKFLELHNGPAVTRVGPVHKLKKPFTYTNYNKALHTARGKYYSGITAFLLNNYMYLLVTDNDYINIEYLNIRGVFENPEDITSFKM